MHDPIAMNRLSNGLMATNRLINAIIYNDNKCYELTDNAINQPNNNINNQFNQFITGLFVYLP